MNTTHTLWPWAIGATHSHGTGVTGPLGVSVAWCGCAMTVSAAGSYSIGEHEAQANARLIAAAPDMYAVLRELAECSQYWSEYDVPLGIHDRIAAALAKAGRQ